MSDHPHIPEEAVEALAVLDLFVGLLPTSFRAPLPDPAEDERRARETLWPKTLRTRTFPTRKD
jgi:hypothetical protein